MDSTVLFPGTVLPLHVTDARTLALIEDALAGDGSLGVALIDPAGERSRESPQLCTVGSLGRIIHAERLPAGSYNVLIQGMQRIRFVEELASPRAYRRFRAELIPDPTEAALGGASRELGRLESCIMSLRSSVEERDPELCEVLRSTPDPVQLGDVLAAAVVSDVGVQQRLLEAQDFAERLGLLIDVLTDVMVRDGEPPKHSQMN